MAARGSALRRAVGPLAAATVLQGLPATVAWRQARVRLLPTLSGRGRSGHVALTFDDGPDPSSTPRFLEALDALGVRGTFFMLGSMAERSPELVKEVALRGHELAVHGWQHSNHLFRSSRWVAGDFQRTAELLSTLSGQEPRFARPPYGILATSTLLGAKRAGLQTVLWTTWGRDWRREATPESVVDEVSRTMGPGPTVLLHDSDCTSSYESWRATLGAVPRLVELWLDQGLEVGPVGEHL